MLKQRLPQPRALKRNHDFSCHLGNSNGLRRASTPTGVLLASFPSLPEQFSLSSHTHIFGLLSGSSCVVPVARTIRLMSDIGLNLVWNSAASATETKKRHGASGWVCPMSKIPRFVNC